jgi:ATP-binding cassette subfamily B multidrug efflux pump
MPLQLDAPIAQGGTNVSGGQRQRLSIARALVRHPQIFVLDDAFSALDVATEARLRSALRAQTKDATVILVAQRVSSIVLGISVRARATSLRVARRDSSTTTHRNTRASRIRADQRALLACAYT